MKAYNKLVSDKIPEIIKNDGKEFDMHYAKNEELTSLLEAKLQEEAKEFAEAKNSEELADILEVVFGLAEAIRIFCWPNIIILSQFYLKIFLHLLYYF